MSKRTIHSVKNSTYLTRAEVEPPIIATIKDVSEESVETPSGPEDKWICYFDELEKGLVLNWVNSQTIAKIAGSESFDDWPDSQIVLYDDPNVMFGKQTVGGIRVRAPRRRPTRQVSPKREPELDEDSYASETPPIEAYDDEIHSV